MSIGVNGPGTRFGLWVVTAMLGLFLFAAGAPTPLYGMYASRWDFTPATLTAIFAVYAVALLVALLVAGSVSDVVGRRPGYAIVVAVLATLSLTAARSRRRPVLR